MTTGWDDRARVISDTEMSQMMERGRAEHEKSLEAKKSVQSSISGLQMSRGVKAKPGRWFR